MKIKLIDDGKGSVLLPLSDALMARLGWQIGDEVEVEALGHRAIRISQTSLADLSVESRVQFAAIAAFGDKDKASNWLNREHHLLGATPLEYLERENGEQEVLKILNSIMYGGAV